MPDASPRDASAASDASRITTLAEAAALVRDGDHLALGGFAVTRNSVAFSHELIRQGGRRGLTLSQCILGMDADLLVGAGMVERVIYGGGSLDRFGQLQRVNQSIEQGTLVAEYTSSLSICFRYLAGALGLPFMPIKSLLGSTMLDDLAGEIAPDTIREMDCPFTGEHLVLVRALVPDVAVVVVQRADAQGNAQVFGPRWDNNEAIKAARKVVLLAEEIVPTEVIRQQPELTLVPGYRVAAVVPLPFAAHPTSVYRCYDYDAEHVREYAARSRDQAGFDAYLGDYVRPTRDHFDYLERVGGTRRLAALRADPMLGY